MCDCINWYGVVAIICFVILIQVLIYEIGYMHGAQSAYNRFKKACNECRNKKMNLPEKLTC